MIKLSVSIDVPNVEQAELFYVNALGCTKVRDQGGMVVLRSDNADIFLLARDEGSAPLASGDVAGSDVAGSDVAGSDVAGSDVAGSDVAGSDVAGSDVAEGTDVASTRSYKRHWTPVHLDFLCENVDEIVSKITEFGGTHEGGERGDWGAIAHCADPFGNGFCVINE